jgi:hypothetical protein
MPTGGTAVPVECAGSSRTFGRHTRDGAVLADWDSVSYGPREQDLVPTRMRVRFGEPACDWDEFCMAYGFDPGQLPGLPLLQQMRELRTLAAYLRSQSAAAQAEVGRRIADLISGIQDPRTLTLPVGRHALSSASTTVRAKIRLMGGSGAQGPVLSGRA